MKKPMSNEYWNNNPLVKQIDDDVIYYSYCVIGKKIYKVENEHANKMPKDIVSWHSKRFFSRVETNQRLIELYRQFVKKPIKEFEDRSLLVDHLWEFFGKRAKIFTPSPLMFINAKPKIEEEPKPKPRKPRVKGKTFVSRKGEHRAKLTGKKPVSKINALRLKHYKNKPKIKDAVKEVTLKALRYDLKMKYIEEEK